MRAVALLVATLALALFGCGGPDRHESSDDLLVTAPKGAAYGFDLIGPLSLDIETVSGRRCFMVKAIGPTDQSAHGVIWPYGTTIDGVSLMVPGLTDPLRNGDTFWAGGGAGGDESDTTLGPCDRGFAYYLGPLAFLTDPRVTPVPGTS
jgi:hypothetical protein